MCVYDVVSGILKMGPKYDLVEITYINLTYKNEKDKVMKKQSEYTEYFRALKDQPYVLMIIDNTDKMKVKKKQQKMQCVGWPCQH